MPATTAGGSPEVPKVFLCRSVSVMDVLYHRDANEERTFSREYAGKTQDELGRAKENRASSALWLFSRPRRAQSGRRFRGGHCCCFGAHLTLKCFATDNPREVRKPGTILHLLETFHLRLPPLLHEAAPRDKPFRNSGVSNHSSCFEQTTTCGVKSRRNNHMAVMGSHSRGKQAFVAGSRERRLGHGGGLSNL